MKKLLFLIFWTILFGSCVDDVIMPNSDKIGLNKVTFSYDSVTNPVVWRTFRTFREKMDACQIPINILKKISTDTLVALCMNHPMANNYIFYENPLIGVKFTIEGFNGFQELKQRADAAVKILDYYEKMVINDAIQQKKNKYTKYRTEINSFKLGFVELFIASNEIPSLYSVENISRLEKVSNAKYEQKLKCKNYRTSIMLSKSLLIAAQVKMAKSDVFIGENSKKLKQFIETGGIVSGIMDLKEISRIIYAK